MVKNTGRLWDSVAEILQVKGMDTQTLEIATLGRGTDHLVLMNGDTIGEYNHKSRQLYLYDEH